MKTLLCLVLLLGQDAHAADCWIPVRPVPCKPKASTHAEHLRCVLMDNDALRAYATQAEFALRECSARVKPQDEKNGA